MSDRSANENSLTKVFLDTWLRGFLDAFEAQAGVRISEEEGLPATPVTGELALVGLEQCLDEPAGAAFWVGVTETQTNEVGKVLTGDGESEEAPAREALLGLLRSALESAVQATVAKYQLGQAQAVVTKTFDTADLSCFTPIRFSGPDVQFEIYLGISPRLQQWIEARSDQKTPVPAGSALEQLFDFELPVSFSFGRKKLSLKDVLKLAPSSVVELDRAPDDWVEVIVNDSVIAWGEVVSMEGQYGIKIRRIASGGLQAPPLNSTPAAPVRAMVEA